jgi:hypothetical protein
VKKQAPRRSPRAKAKKFQPQDAAIAGNVRRTARRRSRASTARSARPVAAVPVSADELRALRRELERRLSSARTASRPASPTRARKPAPLRWNPDPEDVQKSVAQLVLTIVEFLRQLMERQAVRRMEANTLTDAEVEAVGSALMRLEETVRELGARFGLTPEDLNLDLGPVKLL